MFHFRVSIGKSVKCDAKEQECPLVHGDTPEEAQRNYEAVRAAERSTLSTLGKENTRDAIDNLSVSTLRALPSESMAKTPLKKLDAAQLAQTLRHEAILAGMDADTIDSAVDLATVLHAHQRRGNRGNFESTPYIEHPLRNAVRLLRLGTKKQDVIVAAILHDTIEDGAKVFVKQVLGKEAPDEISARDYLRRYIVKVYGKEVARLVEAVTNDYIADSDKARMSTDEKNLIYKNHVQSQVTGDPDVFLVKVSDFIDNATGLYNNDIPSRRDKTLKQAVKYLPVVQVFKDAMKDTDLGLTAEGRKMVTEQLDRTTARLEEIIAKYS